MWQKLLSSLSVVSWIPPEKPKVCLDYHLSRTQHHPLYGAQCQKQESGLDLVGRLAIIFLGELRNEMKSYRKVYRWSWKPLSYLLTFIKSSIEFFFLICTLSLRFQRQNTVFDYGSAILWNFNFPLLFKFTEFPFCLGLNWFFFCLFWLLLYFPLLFLSHPLLL